MLSEGCVPTTVVNEKPFWTASNVCKMSVDYLPKQRTDRDVALRNEESRDYDITDGEFSAVTGDTSQGKTNITVDI